MLHADEGGPRWKAVDDLVQALGIDAAICKREVCRICAGLDLEGRVFREASFVDPHLVPDVRVDPGHRLRGAGARSMAVEHPPGGPAATLAEHR